MGWEGRNESPAWPATGGVVVENDRESNHDLQ